MLFGCESDLRDQLFRENGIEGISDVEGGGVFRDGGAISGYE